jgi:DNA-binding SARP family transcriptional activator/predicted ATPase
MSSNLHLRLLGEFAIAHKGLPITGLSGRSQSLLAYLILHRHGPQMRSRLAALFWPDSSDPQARTNLRKEISSLRRLVPDLPQWLQVDTKTLHWHPQEPVAVDVIDFESQLKAAATVSGPEQRLALEAALALYRGDLLPDAQEDWITLERDRLQQLYGRGLGQLVDCCAQAGDDGTAIDYAQRLIHLDPLNEAGYAALMQLYGQRGDRAHGLQVYHRCMTLLREELGVAPSATLQQLYDQLLCQDERPAASRPQPSRPHLSVPRPSAPSRPPLIGRDREWSILTQWAATLAQPGPTPVLVLLGEMGIGKTRLLEELHATAAPDRAVLWGRGFAAEQIRPYGMWIEALRSHPIPEHLTLPQELGVLLPELIPTPQSPPDRGHLLDAVVHLLRQWAAHQPLMLLFDDLHWMDDASAALLHYAIRLLGDQPVQVAATARPVDLDTNPAVSRLLQSLRRDQRLQSLPVPPLDRAETLTLMQHTDLLPAGDRSIEQADRIFVESGGNPLFALEVMRALAQNHTATSLDALIRDRLQHLDDRARTLLPWAAALGRSFQPTLVATITDQPLPHLLTALDHLEQHSIIRPSQTSSIHYDFVHDIVRQVVYQQQSEPRRQLMHLQIAHRLQPCLTQDPALASAIAHHAMLGGDDHLAATMALTAAERGLKLFAYAEALELAQRGIHHCQSLDDRTRVHLHLSLLRVCAIAGVRRDQVAALDAETQELIQTAIALGSPEDEAIGIETLVVLHFSHSNFHHVQHHSQQATAASRAASPVTAARLLAYGGACLAEIGRDMVRAEALLLEAQTLAERIDLELLDLFSGLGCIERHRGNYDHAREQFQRHWHRARAEQDHWREVFSLSYLAMTDLEAGQPASAILHATEMARVANQIQGEGSEGAIAAALLALAHYQLNSPDASTRLDQALTQLQQLDAQRMMSYILTGAALVDIRCDRPDLALRRATAALAAAQTLEHPSEIALAWAVVVHSQWNRGDRDRARSTWNTLVQQVDRSTLSALATTILDQVHRILHAPTAHPVLPTPNPYDIHSR